METRNCKNCNTLFEILDRDLEFYEKISPRIEEEIIKIPSPKLCPDCRQQRRLSFLNERNLYRRECDITKKNIISIFSPDKEIKVFESKEWWWDNWTAFDYWKNPNFEKSMFDNFKELFLEVPKSSLTVINSENSEYNNFLSYSKNTYMSFGSEKIEDSSYVSSSQKIKKSFDIWWSDSINDSYEVFDCYRVYKSFYVSSSKDLSNCNFCDNCLNCQFCTFSSGLVNKKYCIMNKEYSKEEYEKKLSELNFFEANRISEYKEIYRKFLLTIPHKYNHSENIEKSIGDYIYNVKNSFCIFNGVELEDSSYAYECGWTSKLWDCSHTYKGGWNNLESIGISNSFKILFSFDINDSEYIYYSAHMFNCKNCILCTWMKSAEYCILNKQYTKKEYQILARKIFNYMKKTWEWWEFFPSSISLFWYNETVALEYSPLSKEEVKQRWFNWSDYKAPFPKVKKIIPASKLPNNIKDVPDDILNWAIECSESKKLFKIMVWELDFYRRHNIWIPKNHPDERHRQRLNKRNPRKLLKRKCDICEVDIQTTYSLNRDEKILCQVCYEKEMY